MSSDASLDNTKQLPTRSKTAPEEEQEEQPPPMALAAIPNAYDKNQAVISTINQVTKSPEAKNLALGSYVPNGDVDFGPDYNVDGERIVWPGHLAVAAFDGQARIYGFASFQGGNKDDKVVTQLSPAHNPIRLPKTGDRCVTSYHALAATGNGKGVGFVFYIRDNNNSPFIYQHKMYNGRVTTTNLNIAAASKSKLAACMIDDGFPMVCYQELPDDGQIVSWNSKTSRRETIDRDPKPAVGTAMALINRTPKDGPTCLHLYYVSGQSKLNRITYKNDQWTDRVLLAKEQPVSEGSQLAAVELGDDERKDVYVFFWNSNDEKIDWYRDGDA